MKQWVQALVCLSIGWCVFGCVTPKSFPTPKNAKSVAGVGVNDLSGREIFKRTFETHGGKHLDELTDLNVGVTGEWKYLIKKIQPLVTDFAYRIDSQERLHLQNRSYAALYTGPGGEKKVFRTPEAIEVYYNGQRSLDKEVLSASALTADAFYLFLLGPLALEPWAGQFTRLADASDNSRRYFRIHVNKKPGFGFSEADGVVLWVDPINFQTWRIQITLEGHSTTKGAHVEVEYLAFTQRDNFLFPVDFFERVNGPLAIDAHAWHYTGLDINRGWSLDAISGKGYAVEATRPATSVDRNNGWRPVK